MEQTLEYPLINTISEIRKRSGTVTAFNKAVITNATFQALVLTSKADRGALTACIQRNFQQNYENERPHHTDGKWDFGKSNYQSNYIAIRSNDSRPFCLMNKRTRENSRSTLIPSFDR